MKKTEILPNSTLTPNAARSSESDRTLHGYSFLSFSLDDWTGVWRGRHHVMSQLAKSNQVLYVSPPFYIRDVLKPLRAGGEPTGLTAIHQNLHVYSPPRWLPDSYRYPALDRVIKNYRYRQIRRAMHKLDIRNPILYIWHPSFVDVIGRFNESLVVYHVYDEYASFDQEPHQRELLLAQERALLQQANIVFTTSEELSARRLPMNANTHVVRNGVDYQLFSTARHAQTKVPDDLQAIARPIIGCVTTQTPFMDLPLLREIFTRRPDWSFVFIGVARAAPQHATDALRYLQSLPNVHFIPRRTLAEIPGYLKGCDVCAIPWLLNDVTLSSSSPLKLYEYMAAGKPIVCKPTTLLTRHLAGVTHFANDVNEWISAIEAALEDNDPTRVAERQIMARRNTWEQRVQFISERIALQLARVTHDDPTS